MFKVITFVAAMLFSLCTNAQNFDMEGMRIQNSAQKNKGWTLGDTSFRMSADESNNTSARRNAARPLPMTAGDGTILYGEQVYSTLMNVDDDDAIKWGLYSFPAEERTRFTEKLIHNTICANGGGAYHDGKLYFVSYYEGIEPGTFMYLYFCILDVNTLEMEKVAIKGDTFTSIGLDMAYDPVGDVMYSQTYPADAASNPNGFFSLSTVNLENGITTQIAQLDRMSMLAFDMSGQLYGVRYSDGMLVKIDKGTAKVTEVGPTGIIPKYNGSGVFDYEKGTLYWTTTDWSTGRSGIYEINKNTGKASLISEFTYDEQVTCLFLPQSTDRCDLGDITNFKADYSKTSSTSGTVSLTAPSTDARGNAITGDVTVFIYSDGNLMLTKSVAPGTELSEQIDLETKGLHKLEAIASHSATGKSKRISLEVWVGTDGAAAVSNLKLAKSGSDTAVLTWDTPQIGEHGCPINPSLVYYEIRRFPGNELITEDATGNEFREKITDSNYKDYYYAVTSIHKGVKGGTSTSNKVGFGVAKEIPYTETFDNAEAYGSYTSFNNNNDEGFWEYFEKSQCARYKYDTFNRADDWLVTPGIRLGTDNTYKLTFKARSEGSLYPEEIEVYLGNGCDVEAFTTVLVPHTFLEHDAYKEYSAVINVKKEGVYFIAFRAVTKKGQYYLYLDDVSVVDGPSAYIPAEVTDLKVKENTGKEHSISLSFTTPKVNFEGTELSELTSVKIYRNKELIHTFDNPGIGTQLEYVDKQFTTGMNNYAIAGYNSYGEGIVKEISQAVGSDIPLAPTNVKQRTENGSDAIITWTAPKKGKNGAAIAESELTYNIYDNHNNVVAKDVKGTSYTYTVDTSKGQRTLYFRVQAVTSMGKGDAASSNFLTYGKAYEGKDFKESFAGGKYTTSDWFVDPVVESPFNNEFYGRYWGLDHSKYDRGPRPEAQDGDGGCLIAYTDFLDVSSRIISPKINVSTLKNPVLTFWYYHYVNLMPEESYSHRNERMVVEAYVDGKFVTMTDSIYLINGNGWYRYDVQLKDYVGANDFQIAFKTHNWLSYDQHIDNISIRDVADNDLLIESVSVPEVMAAGSERKITATVHNDGKNTAGIYKVEFLRNGEVFATAEGKEEIAFAKSKTLSAAITPTMADAGKKFMYSARVVFDNDELKDNNTSSEIASEVVSNNLPAVNTLKAAAKSNGVALSWNDPENISDYTEIEEGFESYQSFIIDNIGEWKTVDVDRLGTYSIQNTSSETGDYAYPYAGEPMAFQVFSPSEAKITSKLWTPYLGDKMIICFDAAGSQNDDWLISPMVKGGTKVSFMAKSVTDAYGLEKFIFKCSYNTNDIKYFEDESDIITVPNEWTRYEFTLDPSATYFAINCISQNSYALLIDDIQFEKSEPMALNLTGYNVYRDNVKINDELVTDKAYSDTTAEPGNTSYVYNVTAVYDRGESMFGNSATPDNTGIENVSGANAEIYVSNSAIHVSNAEGCRVSVIDMDGKVLYSTVATGSEVSFGVPAGVYVVRVAQNAFKIVIK